MIGHTLVVGKTAHGKTTIVKKMVARCRKVHKMPVIVLTPFKGDDWGDADKYDDPDLFIEEVFRRTGCVVVVDEAGDFIGRVGGVLNRLATRGRHYGHICFFIVQRALSVDINTRANCSNIFIFRSSSYDIKELARDFTQLEKTEFDPSNFNVGECLVIVGNKPPVLMNVFTDQPA